MARDLPERKSERAPSHPVEAERSNEMPDNDVEQRIRERAFYIWIEQGQAGGEGQGALAAS